MFKTNKQTNNNNNNKQWNKPAPCDIRVSIPILQTKTRPWSYLIFISRNKHKINIPNSTLIFLFYSLE